MTDASPPRTRLLTLRGVRRAFGATKALQAVDIDASAGEIHAIVGENGAGKSTLMAILAGVLAPDGGEMTLRGERYAPRGAADAQARGVALVPQEPAICGDLTVAENVVLGREPRRGGLIDRTAQRDIAQRALAHAGADIGPDARAHTLSPAERQLVSIARALTHPRLSLLIFDEPTSALPADDAEKLFAIMRRLRDGGLAILYISHFLEEVRRLCDRYTVLREGCSVASGPMEEATLDDIVRHMLGRDLPTARPRRSAKEASGDVALRVTDLAGQKLPIGASLEILRGEVVGITGLVGSGRTELVRAIFGLDVVRRGEVRVLANERATALGVSPRSSIRAGVGLLSEDRQDEGLAADMSITENLTLSRLEPFRRAGILRLGAMRDAAKRWVTRLRVRAPDVDAPISVLSGGNQQKVALGRLLHQDADVFLLDEPTRGIDLGSREDIYELCDDLVRGGKSILWISSQQGEVLRVADRVSVMRRGFLLPPRPASELDEHALLLLATSADETSAAPQPA